MGTDGVLWKPSASCGYEPGRSEPGHAPRLVDADDRADECGVLHRFLAPAIPESPDVRRVQRCATSGAGPLRGWDDRRERDDPVDGAFRDPRCRNGPGWLSVGDDLVRHLPSHRRTADDRGGSVDPLGGGTAPVAVPTIQKPSLRLLSDLR